jgi:hypothetical protein
LLINAEITVNPCVISPEDYQRFAEIQAKLNNPDMSIILLTCPVSEPEITVETNKKTVTPNSKAESIK